MIKHERRKLHSRYENGVLMYPGEYVFTWVRIGLVWHLAGISEVVEP